MFLKRAHAFNENQPLFSKMPNRENIYTQVNTRTRV